MTQSPQEVARRLLQIIEELEDFHRVEALFKIEDVRTLCNAVLAGQKAVEEERERCRSRAVQIVGWHRNDYNRQQIDAIVAELRNALPGNPPPTTTHAAEPQKEN